jgi:predicted phage terminase large subunit-like protein
MDKNIFEGIDLRQIQIARARKTFYEFCRLTEPDFYTEKKPHLKKLATILQDFYQERLLKDNGEPFEKIMIRFPPQFGKSRTLVNFTKWVLGNNQEERIITGSYGDSPATEFSRYTRDGIREEANTREQFVFSTIFPEVRVKKTDASVQKWALEGQHFNYLGVGCGGAVTGKGATLRIIDDIIKDAEEAMNEAALDKIWRWFTGTFSSRTSAKGGKIKEIFCGTLWGERDPQMILQETEGDEWYVLSMPVYNEEKDEMLCDDIMNKKAFHKLKARMLIDSQTKMIFYANYMCEAIDDNETKVFPRSSLKTYRNLPMDVIYTEVGEKRVPMGWNFAFIDAADEGQDNFAMAILTIVPSIVSGEGGSAYLIDCVFDPHNLTVQEMQVKAKIREHKIRKVVIETNNAGAYFVRRCRTLNRGVEFYGQWSKANKMSRINGMAWLIKSNFYFPEEPNPTVAKFMKQVYRLLKTSKKDDDAPDSLAGACFHLDDTYKLFG